MLQRLTYFSDRISGAIDVEALVGQAAARNRERDITGLLIADGDVFLQVLEGERAALSALFQTISRDPRHANVVLVDVEEIAASSFPNWGMGQLSDTTRARQLWSSAHGAFEPREMSARQIRDFVRSVSFELLGRQAAWTA